MEQVEDHLFTLIALFLIMMVAGVFFAFFIPRPSVSLLFSVLLLIGIAYSVFDPLTDRISTHRFKLWLERILSFLMSSVVFLLFLALNHKNNLYYLFKQAGSEIYKWTVSHGGSWILNGRSINKYSTSLECLSHSFLIDFYSSLSIFASISIVFLVLALIIPKRYEQIVHLKDIINMNLEDIGYISNDVNEDVILTMLIMFFSLFLWYYWGSCF